MFFYALTQGVKQLLKLCLLVCLSKIVLVPFLLIGWLWSFLGFRESRAVVMLQRIFNSIDVLTLDSVRFKISARTGLNMEIDGVLLRATLRRNNPDAAGSFKRLASGYFKTFSLSNVEHYAPCFLSMSGAQFSVGYGVRNHAVVKQVSLVATTTSGTFSFERTCTHGTTFRP
jgi:hypothetical protein